MLFRVCQIGGVYLADPEIDWQLLEIMTRRGKWYCRMTSEVCILGRPRPARLAGQWSVVSGQWSAVVPLNLKKIVYY